MKRYKIWRGKDDLNSTGGNYFCGLILKKLTHILPINFSKRRSDAIRDRDILMSQVGLLCNARTDFNDIELYKNDELFRDAFDLSRVPSEVSLRTRLDEMPQDICHSSLRSLNTALLKKCKFKRVDVEGIKLVPVDMDVSPFDNSGSHKMGVSYTYKGHDGFAPMFAYIGKEGHMLDCELRPGKQHCQSGTPEFIRRNVERIKELGLSKKCLIRLDSGNDAQDNFDAMGDEYFLIKRNLRKESKEQWLAMARSAGEKRECRPGKNVYTGFVHHLHPGGNEERPAVPVAFEVIERKTDIHGQQFLQPELEINTWWLNFPCSKATDAIELYHDHGTSEQFHSELKSDLNVERLPSGKLCVNKIVLLCAMVAFNVLRTLGQAVIERKELAPIKIKVDRWRMKTILQNMIYCAVKRVRHAGQQGLNFGRHCPWFDVLEDIATAYA
jgi:hypothetical protein